ncbi:MAG: nuclear transport factor 2 family protein [Candidatus Dormibacteraeota bacterium]|nr:nuclear transport factor 2 family protein [Candidatus Dormibacteraeota bacterium]
METTINREANVKLLGDGYAAFGRGDLDTVRTLFRPDMVWHALRLGTLSGDHVGREAVFAFFGQSMALTQGTFSVVPEEILASETTGAVVVRSRGRRGNRELDDRQVHLYRLVDGQVAEVWQYTGPGADEFWS